MDSLSDIKRILSDQDFNAAQQVQIVFDVGANVGQSAIRFAQEFPGARIFAFEPVPATFAQMAVNIQSYRNVQAFQIGFGPEEGMVPIHTYQSSLVSSLVAYAPAMAISSAEYVGETVVDLHTIDSFAQEKQIDLIDILKIDTEGADYEVLVGAQNMLQRGAIRFIIFEFFLIDDSETSRQFASIHRYLDSCGFRSVAFYTDFVNPKHKVAIYNALYMFWGK